MKERRVIYRQIKKILGLNTLVIRSILKEHLQGTKLCFVWEQHGLIKDQKVRHIKKCREILKMLDNRSRSRWYNRYILEWWADQVLKQSLGLWKWGYFSKRVELCTILDTQKKSHNQVVHWTFKKLRPNSILLFWEYTSSPRNCLSTILTVQTLLLATLLYFLKWKWI